MRTYSMSSYLTPRIVSISGMTRVRAKPAFKYALRCAIAAGNQGAHFRDGMLLEVFDDGTQRFRRIAAVPERKKQIAHIGGDGAGDIGVSPATSAMARTHDVLICVSRCGG